MQWTEETKLENVPKSKRGAFVKWKSDRSKSIDDRFWEKVNKGTEHECWPFRTSREGYGSFYVPGDPPTHIRSNRMAWILTRGHIPDGLHVLHECDNPCCCNPNHLFLGTHKENMKDMTTKIRSDWIPDKRLSDLEIIEIRRRYHPSKTTHALLAREFRVTEAQIRSALSNRIRKGRHRKLSEDQVREIKEAHRLGASIRTLGRQFGVSHHTIHCIIKCKTWLHVAQGTE
jgi:hypothetical protein